MALDKHNDKDDVTSSYHVTEQVGHLLRKAYQRHHSIFQANSSDPDLTSVQL